ncbi:MAG: hypothetical protein OXC07_07665 [Kistimonas sp.]|nr:hypothetical protein [Kistimonas sp.]
MMNTALTPAVAYTEHVVCDPGSDSAAAIKKAFVEEGFIVVKNVSTTNARKNAVDLVRRQIDVCPEASIQGFFELYHDDALAQLRQNPDLVKTFSILWGCQELWVVFDRFIYMTEHNRETPLPLHVDQNPHTQPQFCSTQGLLGVIPRSHRSFGQYRAWSDDRQGYVEYQGDDLPARRDALRAVRLNEGEMVIWDSRLTHSRFNAVPTTSSKARERVLAMISFMPASADEQLREKRCEALRSGTGAFDHAAGLRKTAHAHIQSLRVTPENLTDLGHKIYGVTPW